MNGELWIRSTCRSAHVHTLRAVSRSGICGMPAALRAPAARFDDEIRFIGALDGPGYGVGRNGPGEQGFGEVREPVNTLRIKVPHEEHGAELAFRPWEFEHSAQVRS